MTYWPLDHATLSPDRRRRLRTVGLMIMARRPLWRVRHHRGMLGGEYVPLPADWILSRND